MKISVIDASAESYDCYRIVLRIEHPRFLRKPLIEIVPILVTSKSAPIRLSTYETETRKNVLKILENFVHAHRATEPGPLRGVSSRGAQNNDVQDLMNLMQDQLSKKYQLARAYGMNMSQIGAQMVGASSGK